MLRSISPTILLCHDATTARLTVRWRCGAVVVGTGGYLVTLMFISVEYAKLLWILLALGPVLLAIVSSPERERGLRASLARAH